MGTLQSLQKLKSVLENTTQTSPIPLASIAFQLGLDQDIVTKYLDHLGKNHSVNCVSGFKNGAQYSNYWATGIKFPVLALMARQIDGIAESMDTKTTKLFIDKPSNSASKNTNSRGAHPPQRLVKNVSVVDVVKLFAEMSATASVGGIKELGNLIASHTGGSAVRIRKSIAYLRDIGVFVVDKNTELLELGGNRDWFVKHKMDHVFTKKVFGTVIPAEQTSDTRGEPIDEPPELYNEPPSHFELESLGIPAHETPIQQPSTPLRFSHKDEAFSDKVVQKNALKLALTNNSTLLIFDTDRYVELSEEQVDVLVGFLQDNRQRIF